MKYALFIPALVFSFCVAAQKAAIDDLFNTENSFAAWSVEHGTKAAFLNFLDSNAVVFEKGKAVNGIDVWIKKAAGAGILNWRPTYGFISSSGDLGITTGPWTFQPKTTNDSVVASGQFSTVWKKNKGGVWKVVLDLGNNNVPLHTGWTYTDPESLNKFIPGTWNNLLNREQKFAAQTAAASVAERSAIYAMVVSQRHYFLNRNGQTPATALKDLKKSNECHAAKD